MFVGLMEAAWGTLVAGTIAVALSVDRGQRCYRVAWEKGSLAAIYGMLFAAMFVVAALRAADAP